MPIARGLEQFEPPGDEFAADPPLRNGDPPAVEAAALLSAHLGVVTALVDAIVERGVLTGDEVDQVIMQAMVAETLAVECQRRRDWQERLASAAAFVAAVQP
jgi:hypothetical protein